MWDFSECVIVIVIVIIADPDPERDGHRSGQTGEQRCLPHFSSCCLPGSPGPLRFVAQNLRIPVTSNSVHLFQQQPVFDSFLRVSLMFNVLRPVINTVFVFDVNDTLSSTVCKCTLCQQRKSHQLQHTLFRGVMTPSLTPVRPGH